MMKRVIWTDALDESLRKARLEDQMSWDEIAPMMGITREICVRRAKELEIPTGRLQATQAMSARRSIRRL
jgi:hypothetical protein